MKDLTPAFLKLSAMMRKHTSGMLIKTDAPDNFYVEQLSTSATNKPKFFGAVQIKKSYVSYHLMPIYEDPSLIADISPALRERMQGKSCFNFKVEDESLFLELDELTRRSAAAD
jgi:hypothetical protein